jgi:hypothetical protein
MSSRRTCAVLGMLVWLSLAQWEAVSAQNSGPIIELAVRKEYGYQLGTQLQGRISIEASSSDALARVEFFIDDRAIALVEQAPFRTTFSTSDYAVGEHCIHAEVMTLTGQSAASPTQCYEFLSPEESMGAVMDFVLPLLVSIILLMGLGMAATAWMSRRADGFQLGKYSGAGGAVCRHCQLPFGRHLLSLNLLVGKLERCPHCGKWGILPRASMADLESAERRFKEDAKRGITHSVDEESRWKQQIEDSRYEP